MTDTHQPDRSTSANDLPPFWVRPTGPRGSSVDPDVIREARRLWPWFYRHVQTALHDAPCAAQLLEEVAYAVSERLGDEPEVGRNLKGYLIASLHNRVGREVVRSGRITYEGLLRELEGKHSLVMCNWHTSIEVKICVGQVIALMPPDVRTIVHYRLLEYTWEDIAKATGIPGSQAKNRYYYGIRLAWDRLREDSPKYEPSGEPCL